MKKWIIRDAELLVNPNNKREAVRGLLLTEDRSQMLLLYYKKHHFYTLPGGGLEPDEDAVTAFWREVKEETGFDCDCLQELGIIEEHRTFVSTVQINHIYFAQVSSKQSAKQLDEKENLDGLELEILPVFEAYQKVFEQATSTEQQRFLSQRDKIVLQEGLKIIGQSGLLLEER
ncbi:NUDIX hydrolase [Streptococcus merionis]|uniref:NUDIX hydrolase n=1 Tax=Streptococcus merionis TaxID=400065 RepID=UPI0026EBAB8E|nr:NUDIX domain-containing protein [Streptococcus merionis]